MGEGVAEIPFLDFSKEAMELKQGSEEWKAMSGKVREACEVHGCFLLSYDNISTKLQEDMFMAMKTLFDLPQETKIKHTSPKPYGSYSDGRPMVPLLESFGVDDAESLNSAQAFTNLMWPEGNPSFCGILNSMSLKMQELFHIIMKMILDSFGVEKYYDSQIKSNENLFRLMKYKAPSEDESAIGLLAHADKNTLAILCQNGVQGLELLTQEGNWVPLFFPKGSFLVVVGEALKAWSNGRLHAVRHRVVMTKGKERYSCGLFTLPKEGVPLEVPSEFVDKEHPLLYRPFTFREYLSYFVANSSDDALEIYAGV